MSEAQQAALGVVLSLAAVVHANARAGGPTPGEVREYAALIERQLVTTPVARAIVGAFATHLGAAIGD